MLSLYILLALQSSNCTTLPFLHSDVHSYLQHMGVAEAKCLSGCECSSVQMDGTWPYKLSLFTFKSFAVSRRPCLPFLLWKAIWMLSKNRLCTFCTRMGLLMCKCASRPC